MVSPIVAVLVAIASTLVQALGSPEASGPHPASPGEPPPTDVQASPRRGKQRKLTSAFGIILVVIGVGGFALTFGVRYVVGYITGNEPGTERLVESATGTAQGLTLTVGSVVQTDHFTPLEQSFTDRLGAAQAQAEDADEDTKWIIGVLVVGLLSVTIPVAVVAFQGRREARDSKTS